MTLDEAERNYRVILCDIWGCIHDGVRLYPGAEARRDIADLIGAGCELGRAQGRLEVTAGDLAPQER